MIEYRYVEEGVWAAMFICDQCNMPISLQSKTSPGGIAGGIVVWSAEETPARGSLTNPRVGQRPVLHLHKGRCDQKATHGKGYLWEDIDLHLLHLMYNTGLWPESKLREVKKRAKALAEIGI